MTGEAVSEGGHAGRSKGALFQSMGGHGQRGRRLGSGSSKAAGRLSVDSRCVDSRCVDPTDIKASDKSVMHTPPPPPPKSWPSAFL